MIHLQLPDKTEYRVTENNGILILEGKERRAVKVKGQRNEVTILHEAKVDLSSIITPPPFLQP